VCALPFGEGEITQYRAILTPNCGAAHGCGQPSGPDASGADASGPDASAPGGLILQALAPVRDQLDATLCCDDRPAALQLVYRALVPIAEALAAWRGDLPRRGMVRVHALLVELEPLPLACRTDGTVSEQGAAVSVLYRNWLVDGREAGRLAQQLTHQWHIQWPGAWFMVTPEGAAIGAGV
jgi:hypothetical protein